MFSGVQIFSVRVLDTRVSESTYFHSFHQRSLMGKYMFDYLLHCREYKIHCSDTGDVRKETNLKFDYERLRKKVPTCEFKIAEAARCYSPPPMIRIVSSLSLDTIQNFGRCIVSTVDFFSIQKNRISKHSRFFDLSKLIYSEVQKFSSPT